jgi:hypothetical protein
MLTIERPGTSALPVPAPSPCDHPGTQEAAIHMRRVPRRAGAFVRQQAERRAGHVLRQAVAAECMRRVGLVTADVATPEELLDMRLLGRILDLVSLAA